MVVSSQGMEVRIGLEDGGENKSMTRHMYEEVCTSEVQA